MTIRFNISAELNIESLEISELECVHHHAHKDDNKNFIHQHNDDDDNSLGSLKGSASLKFDCGLDFDATPEEMKASFEMIQALGGKFAEVARKSKDLGERVVTKINQASQESKSETKPEADKPDDEAEDKASTEIEIKSLLKQATELISAEESKVEPDIEQLDWANIKLKSATWKFRRAALDGVIIDSDLDEECGNLKKRLAALNEKC